MLFSKLTGKYVMDSMSNNKIMQSSYCKMLELSFKS